MHHHTLSVVAPSEVEVHEAFLHFLHVSPRRTFPALYGRYPSALATIVPYPTPLILRLVSLLDHALRVRVVSVAGNLRHRLEAPKRWTLPRSDHSFAA